MRPLISRSVLSAVLTLVPLTTAFAQQPPPPLPIGSKAPAFTTKTLDGKTLSLKSLRGHVVLLDYWATWCGPCRMATPTLEMLHNKYAAQGLRVVGMSVDDPSTVKQIPKFKQFMHVTYTLTADPGPNMKAAQHYHATGIPSQYLIDKHGVIRWAQAGFSPNEGVELSAMIKKLLAEKA